MTQSVIKNRIENMRLLVQKLKKYFTYVSVLGCDVQSQAVRADKRVTTFNEQLETDRGFVIRMYGGDSVAVINTSDRTITFMAPKGTWTLTVCSDRNGNTPIGNRVTVTVK